METKKGKHWELIGHSYQIVYTGDYGGHYEVTNGKISLLTIDDDDEAIQPIVDALNDSGVIFYQDDFFDFENRIIKQELEQLKEKTTSQQQTIERLRKCLSNLLRVTKNYEVGNYSENIYDCYQEAEQLLNTTEPIDQ